MTLTNKDDLVVARRPGTRLLLAGGPGGPISFAGPSERTFFFQRKTVDAELRRLRVSRDSVELRPAKLSFEIH